MFMDRSVGARRLSLILVLFCVVAAALLVLARAGLWPFGGAGKPDILLITVDTLRPDHLSLYGYGRPTSPELDRYFADADLYRRAYSAHACTPPATVSLLTGLYPPQHGVRKFFRPLRPEVATLPDRLRAAGYQTAAVVSNYVLRGESTDLSSRFDHYDDVTDEAQPTRKRFFERRGSRTTDAALSWLRERRDPARPHFLWVHYMDPHSPYMAPEVVTDFSHPSPIEIDLQRVRRHTRLPRVKDGGEYVDRYDEEIAYVDRHIGRLLDAYRELSLLDGAVVVLTADHGENLIEHERYFNHCSHVWDSIMRIPMVVRRPRHPGRRIDVPVSLVDVAPSLLQYAGLPVPEGLDGKPFESRAPDDLIHLAAIYQTDTDDVAIGVVSGSHKWGVKIGGGEIRERWFFDLDDDPGELEPGPWRRGEGAAGLLARAAHDHGVALQPETLSPREREAMRALGYLE